MKLEVIISPGADERIVIHAKERDETVAQIEAAVESILNGSSAMRLTIRDTEYYVPRSDILYFETENSVVKAHTADRIFTCEERLFELERSLPSYFLRISKSCIVNVSMVEAMRKNPLGASEVFLKGTAKKVYASRLYYKTLREKLESVNSNKTTYNAVRQGG